MRVGVSTACFYPQTLEDILPVLADIGVQATEIFINTISELTPQYYEQLGKTAARLGLDIVSLHPFTSLMEGMLLFSVYPRRTKDGLALYQQYFQCAASLGARFLTFHGEREMGFGADSPEKWAAKCEVYNQLCELAASYGVTLTQENVAWCRSGDPEFIRLLAESVPALRFTLDIKQTRRAQQDWRRFIEVEKDRLANIHINDFSQTQTCLLPGQGEFDYAAFFGELKKIHYQGDTLIEVYRSDFKTIDEMRQAVQVLSSFITP